MKYLHFVITRFNIPAKYEGKKNPNLEGVDPKTNENYLEERVRLFEKYTVPSMKSQTNSNFKWLVLFSDQTPQKYKDKMKLLRDQNAWFCPLYLKDEEAYEFDNYLEQILKQYECDQYITTRIDNDDAVSIDFIEAIQNYIVTNNIENTMLSFKYGYQFSENHSTLSLFLYPQNHFTTMVYSKAGKTIISFPHNKIPSNIKRVLIDSRKNPIWMEIIHKTNYVNKTFFNCKNAMKSKHALDRYDCNIPWERKAVINNLLYSIPGTFQCIGSILRKK